MCIWSLLLYLYVWRYHITGGLLGDTPEEHLEEWFPRQRFRLEGLDLGLHITRTHAGRRQGSVEHAVALVEIPQVQPPILGWLCSFLPFHVTCFIVLPLCRFIVLPFGRFADLPFDRFDAMPFYVPRLIDCCKRWNHLKNAFAAPTFYLLCRFIVLLFCISCFAPLILERLCFLITNMTLLFVFHF